MFFGIGSRWHNWKPDAEYLSKVKEIDTIAKLHSFMSDFKYKWDTITILLWTILWDNWKMPDQSAEYMYGDCEDAAILAIDILGRIQKREDARFIMTFGYCIWNGKKKYMGHAVTAFLNNDKYDIFSNNTMEYGFKDFEEIGKKFYPLGLKYQEIRDWKGNVLKRRFQLIGTF